MGVEVLPRKVRRKDADFFSLSFSKSNDYFLLSFGINEENSSELSFQANIL